MSESLLKVLDFSKQLRFQDFPASRIASEIERLKVGQRACDVLVALMRGHPDIAEFSYTTYDIKADSGVEERNGSLVWVGARDLTENRLSELSDQNHKVTYGWEATEEIMGVTSLVRLVGGSMVHIPMIDFLTNDPDKIETGLDPHKGFLLDSGGACHFWGSQLLPENKWRDFLEYLHKLWRQGISVDEDWLEASEENGFSVLRIFAYPPDKPVEPEIIKVVS